MKEFSFQIKDHDIGIQFVDLGSKDEVHTHFSIYKDGKEYICIGSLSKVPTEELYDHLLGLAECLEETLEENKDIIEEVYSI